MNSTIPHLSVIVCLRFIVIQCHTYVEVSINGKPPKWMVYHGQSQLKVDDNSGNPRMMQHPSSQCQALCRALRRSVYSRAASMQKARGAQPSKEWSRGFMGKPAGFPVEFWKEKSRSQMELPGLRDKSSIQYPYWIFNQAMLYCQRVSIDCLVFISRAFCSHTSCQCGRCTCHAIQ